MKFIKEEKTTIVLDTDFSFIENLDIKKNSLLVLAQRKKLCFHSLLDIIPTLNVQLKEKRPIYKELLYLKYLYLKDFKNV